MALTEVKSSSGLWEAQQSGRGTPNDGSIVPGVTLLDTTGAPYTASSGGGGGGPATIADAADVAKGSVADTAWGGSGSATEIALLKALTLALLNGTGKVNSRKATLVDDSIRTAPDQAATATLSNVAAVTTAGGVQLVAALAKSSSVTGRLGLIIVNDSASATLYIAYAATASLTAFTAKVLPGVTWEMPSPIYGGLVSGIWDAAVGNARITELS